MKKAVMIVDAAPAHPFQSASAALNHDLAEYLRHRGYSVRIVGVPSTYVPLAALDTLEALTGAGSVDLAVYCDLSHWLQPLGAIKARRTMVFFHGLVGTPLVWMTRQFDALCCNSPWTLEVLRSLAGFPLWQDRRPLRPDVYHRSHRIRCALPALAHPDGAIAGDALPSQFRDQLDDRACVFGLDSFWEADDQTHLQLIVSINIVARERGDQRVFRLFVQPDKRERLERRLQQGGVGQRLCASLRSVDLRLSDILIPLPSARVRQADLFALMKLCRFALMFNRIPESFGLMPLECVLNDCAVHTNGSGNLRHLLPPSHGITVHDYAPSLDAAGCALEVARAIYQRSLSECPVARSKEADDFERGRRYLRATYRGDAFESDLDDALQDGRNAAQTAWCELRLAKGPLVRRWRHGHPDIVCDTGVVRLTTAQEARVNELLGTRMMDLFGAAPDDQALVSDLWKKGLLTWHG